MRIIVDSERCLGASHCVVTAPELFDQSDAGAVILRREDLTGPAEASARDAAYLCPSGAIRIDLDDRENVMQRRLSFYESVFVHMGINIGLSATTRGTLDRTALAAAFRELVAAHPMLRGRIEQDDQGFVLRTFDGDPPTLDVLDSESGVAEALGTRLPAGGPVIRAVLVPGDDENTVVLILDHTICDGRSATALMASLWQTYTAITQSAPMPPVRDRALPAAMEDRIRAFDEKDLDQYVAEVSARFSGVQPALLPTADPADPADAVDSAGAAGGAAGFAVESIELDEAQTARLGEVGKASGISLHAVLCGAILAGLAQQLEPADGGRTFVCLSSVNMRPRLSPPLPVDTVVLAAAGVQTVVPAPDPVDPIALGRTVYQDVTDAIRHSDLEKATLALPKLLGSAVPVSVGVFNVGWVAVPSLPDGLELVSVRGFALAEGPILTAGAVTVRGRLQLEFPYAQRFFTRDQICAFVTSVRERLDELIAEGE